MLKNDAGGQTRAQAEESGVEGAMSTKNTPLAKSWPKDD